jgi:hypothetical protein
MHLHDMIRNAEILVVVFFVYNNEEEIEARHNRWADVHVLLQRAPPIVPSEHRVGCSENTGASIEGGMNSGFGD